MDVINKIEKLNENTEAQNIDTFFFENKSDQHTIQSSDLQEIKDSHKQYNNLIDNDSLSKWKSNQSCCSKFNFKDIKYKF